MTPPFQRLDFYPGPPLVSDYLAQGPSRGFFHFTPNEQGLRRRLEHLHADEVVVTCGHQACLLGGPLYVAYKILTAVRLCKHVHERFGVKATPLFWLADDDDDIAEVALARPLSGAAIQYRTAEKGVTGLLPSPADTVDGFAPIPAANWGAYHKKLLLGFFEKMGVRVISPLEAGTQALRAPFFRAFEPVSASVAEKVIALNGALREAGHKPQVSVRDGDRFLFSLSGNRRVRLSGKGTLKEGIPLTSALSRLASLEYAFPVLADVSGPAETAYHAQTAPFYESLGRTMPVIWPRFSATLVREADEQILMEQGLSPGELVQDRHAAELRAALRSLPEPSRRALDRLNSGLNALYDGLREALEETDRGVAGAVEAGRRKALQTRPYIEKKLSAAARRRLFSGNAALNGTFDFIYPGTLQERWYNFIFFTGEFPGFLNRLLETADPFAFKHTLVRI